MRRRRPRKGNPFNFPPGFRKLIENLRAPEPVPGLDSDAVPSAQDLEKYGKQFSDPEEMGKVIGKELRRIAGSLVGGMVVKAFGGTNDDMVRMVAAGLGCERVVIERAENQIGDGILICKHGVFECDQCREERKKDASK